MDAVAEGERMEAPGPSRATPAAAGGVPAVADPL